MLTGAQFLLCTYIVLLREWLDLPTYIHVTRQYSHRPTHKYREIFSLRFFSQVSSSSCQVDNHTNYNRDQVLENDACLEMGMFQLNAKLEFAWHAYLTTVTQ